MLSGLTEHVRHGGDGRAHDGARWAVGDRGDLVAALHGLLGLGQRVTVIVLRFDGLSGAVESSDSAVVDGRLSDAAKDRIGNLYVDDEKGTPNYSTLPAFWPVEIADVHARA